MTTKAELRVMDFFHDSVTRAVINSCYIRGVLAMVHRCLFKFFDIYIRVYIKYLHFDNIKRFFCALFIIIIVSSLITASCYPAFSLQQEQEAEIQKIADDILEKISSRLQLPIKNTITINFQNREELRKFLIDKMHKEYPEDELTAMQKSYVKIGLLPANISLEKLLIELYTEQVAGFYEPETKKLVLIKGFDPVLQRAIMIHELAHALQDQHFDLEQLIKPEIDNDDLILAHQAIIEGQATAVMMEIFSGQNLSQLPDLAPLINMSLDMPMFADSALVKAPEYIKKHLIFPYGAGTSFIQHYYEIHKGYNSQQLFSELPSSTEQLMHFEKFFTALDAPVSIEISGFDSLLKPRWRPLYSDVIGELDLFILLKTFLPEDEATRASEGWDGSRFYTFNHPEDNNVLLIWLATFDQEKDAGEFFQSYKKVIEKKYKKEKLTDNQADKFFQWQTEEGLVYLEVKGNDVLIIEGIEPKLLSQVKKVCLGAKRSPY
jgi:hypothetical protein